MPELYRNPVDDIGSEQADYYTHYAAVTGERTAFATTGIKIDRKGSDVYKKRPGSLSVRPILDGMEHTVMVGSVSPDQHIEWTQPANIVIND